MNKDCKQCGTQFEITDEDLKFYERISLKFGEKKFVIPMPTFCPDCRMQRRMTFRNFFNLYHRNCDLTGKKILSMYHQDAKFPVYEMHEWWGDNWDPLATGRDVDLSRSFVEQLREVHDVAPRMSIVNTQSENTDYCNQSFSSKDCYLVFGNVGNEDCYYGHIVWQSKDCYDCLYTYKSEFCYECVDCYECHSLAFSQSCDNCSDSKFLVDCLGCHNCFGCVGLKNKKFHIFNEKYNEAEYAEHMKKYDGGDRKWVDLAKGKVKELLGKEIVKNFHGVNCENVIGDYLYNCKNTFYSYDAKNCEDIKYCATTESFNDSYDCNFSPDKSELCCEGLAVVGMKLFGCHNVTMNASDVYYCDNCYSCRDCFGCVGLKSMRYCILNKQYSREEYEELVPKIVEKMIADEEWGEFLPSDVSPFAYNESIANEYFPMTREEVADKGWQWREDEGEKIYKGPEASVPENINDVEEGICKQILKCEVTGKLYKIVPQELHFYKQMKLPIPLRCFDQRHKERLALRNPRHLWDRNCDKCGADIKTSYASERKETVFCEKCYLEAVY